MRQLRHNWTVGVALVVVALLLHTTGWCFPGVMVGKNGGRAVNHTAHVVLMINGPISVVTIMVDYEGPLEPFAIIMPTAPDVTLARVQAVKREFISRLEQLSAPRFHAFFEKDPCEPEPVQQDWDVRYEANDSGFLAPEFLPPSERHWTVPNEISVPTEPVFKQAESEFRFNVLSTRDRSGIEAWLSARGYRASPDALRALAQSASQGRKLLVAEVNTQRAELLGNGSLQLGAIRYWSREPVVNIASTLGLFNSDGVQDTFIYVLHPTNRFAARNYANVIPPTNIEVDPVATDKLASLYNAVFDAQLAKTPRHVMTEYVWPTLGCGQPCPNAPLTLSELMSLGGDVMEAQLVTKAARLPDPGIETSEEKQQFEEQIQGRSLSERVKALKQHAGDRRELARRRALIARQRYVLSRLHYRYDKNTLPSDIELQAAPDHIAGGIGLPQGPKGVLVNGMRAEKVSHYQVRFVSLFTWARSYECAKPVRWRWGRRWKSLDTALRKVWLALDLPRQSRDQSQLAQLIQSAIPELGVNPKPLAPAPDTTAPVKPVNRSGCAICLSTRSSNWPWVIVLMVVLPTCRLTVRSARRKSRSCGVPLR